MMAVPVAGRGSREDSNSARVWPTTSGLAETEMIAEMIAEMMSDREHCRSSKGELICVANVTTRPAK